MKGNRMALVNVKDGACYNLIDEHLSRSRVFSQKLNSLPETVFAFDEPRKGFQIKTQLFA